MHMHTHIYTSTDTLTYIDTLKYTHTHIHTHIQTHRHTCTYTSIETRSGQSAYPGQMGHFLQVTWVTVLNHNKVDDPVYIFKMATVNSE